MRGVELGDRTLLVRTGVLDLRKLEIAIDCMYALMPLIKTNLEALMC